MQGRGNNPISAGKCRDASAINRMTGAYGVAIMCAVAGIVTACATPSSTGSQSAPPTALSIACTVSSLTPGALSAATKIATIVDPNLVSTLASVQKADQLVHPLVTGACQLALPGSVPVDVAAVPAPQ